MINIKDSKMVSSHHIWKHDSGIIQLTINVHHKAFGVHQYNNDTYLIDNKAEDTDIPIVSDFPVIEVVKIDGIKELFDKENLIRYHPAELHNKNQHTFFWIPMALIGHEKLQERWIKTQKNKL